MHFNFQLSALINH